MAKERDKRKVYKYKYKPRKKRKSSIRWKKVFSVFLTILMLAVLVFLGYTMAGPLLKIIQEKTSVVETTEETLDDSEVVTNVSGDVISNADDEDSDENENVTVVDFSAVRISSDDLDSEDSLEDAVDEIKDNENYDDETAVVVPLKITGGTLKYETSNKDAIAAGAVDADLTLKQIYNTISNAGYEPVAEISMLEDAIYSKYEKSAAFETESGSRWIDNDLDAGGKSWLDPSKTECVSYLKAIASEISQAGFKVIVCTDVKYPEFRQSDIEYLGDDVTGSTRYRNITTLLNLIDDTVGKTGTSLFVCEDIMTYIDGDSEIVKKESLKTDGIVFTIDTDSIKYDSVQSKSGETLDFGDMDAKDIVLALIENANMSDLGKFNIGFEYDGDGFTDEELKDTNEEVYFMGYTSHIINEKE